MKGLDYIQVFAMNVRRAGMSLSSAQVMLAVVDGCNCHRLLVERTNLHPGTVTNILDGLIEQGLVVRIGEGRPFGYRATAEGERMAVMLLAKPVMMGEGVQDSEYVSR